MRNEYDGEADQGVVLARRGVERESAGAAGQPQVQRQRGLCPRTDPAAVLAMAGRANPPLVGAERPYPRRTSDQRSYYGDSDDILPGFEATREYQ